MFYSQEWIDMASEMLAEDGWQFPVERPGSVVRDAGGNEIATPKVSGSIVGVASSYRVREIDGKNIMTGDMKLIADVSWSLAIGDIVTVNGHQWRVVEPNPVCPADTPLLYLAQLRRL